jgi:hypothetical protein
LIELVDWINEETILREGEGEGEGERERGDSTRWMLSENRPSDCTLWEEALKNGGHYGEHLNDHKPGFPFAWNSESFLSATTSSARST